MPPVSRQHALTRDRPVLPARTALLVVDVQNGTFNDAQRAIRPEFFHAARDTVIPNLAALLSACRAAGIEVIYTVIENLTKDGRDRSLDYKLSSFFIARGSWEAKVIDALAPGDDEIVLPKTSSSVFNSTNIDYLLRNIGIEDLVVTGFLTDQCIDHTVKDAADRGYYVTCLTDACMANTHARHAEALGCFAGYCRAMTTAAFLAALNPAALNR
ncbi:cysteine hydrolase family protein [Limobrevibacterium gyesilva]|uniref:Cysteine hydrolase n=1 Tax=Limobrevibacterium gyesilva TaxID=2991712 RepID=A0AA41YXC1_9PROT|nr:isochorismatase family cysteine hydrolase [Limobrevibacterium gyesilva]MCW3477057.1 cysteine hydrolase [Limobrevibacterium gyesilva]